MSHSFILLWGTVPPCEKINKPIIQRNQEKLVKSGNAEKKKFVFQTQNGYWYFNH